MAGVLIFLTTLFASISAKNHYIVEEDHKAMITPKVRAYDASICFFSNGVDSLCFDHQFQLQMGNYWV